MTQSHPLHLRQWHGKCSSRLVVGGQLPLGEEPPHVLGGGPPHVLGEGPPPLLREGPPPLLGEGPLALDLRKRCKRHPGYYNW